MLTEGSNRRIGTGRARWPSHRPLIFRVQGGRRRHESIVMERSLHEMVLRVPAADRLPVGTHLRPIDQAMAERHGFRSAIVRRIERGGEDMRLVHVEILS